MCGFEVSLKRRFGGHGGRPTEWEISTGDQEAKVLIRSLPHIEGIDKSTEEHAEYHSHWIMLPEGVPASLAGEVVAYLASLSRDDLMLALLLASSYAAPEMMPDRL